jgi:hypothetical protein
VLLDAKHVIKALFIYASTSEIIVLHLYAGHGYDTPPSGYIGHGWENAGKILGFGQQFSKPC